MGRVCSVCARYQAKQCRMRTPCAPLLGQGGLSPLAEAGTRHIGVQSACGCHAHQGCTQHALQSAAGLPVDMPKAAGRDTATEVEVQKQRDKAKCL